MTVPTSITESVTVHKEESSKGRIVRPAWYVRLKFWFCHELFDTNYTVVMTNGDSTYIVKTRGIDDAMRILDEYIEYGYTVTLDGVEY